MRRPWAGGLIGALALALGQAHGQPATWTVHGPRGEVLLFGSVHLLPGGLDWRPPALNRALGVADDLWFELPLDQTTNDEVRRLSQRQGVLPATACGRASRPYSATASNGRPPASASRPPL